MRANVHACRVHTLLSQLTRIAIAMLLPGQQRIAIAMLVLCQQRENVLFIGTQFSILYTSMYSPASAATLTYSNCYVSALTYSNCYVSALSAAS
jgi:hypothetical protein